jgi:CubicO group peptidase (beta-lactamase class C family)
VLAHTTGLRNWRSRVEQPLAPDFEPGERFQYSGEGFYWLQRVVETVTGQGIGRVMRERLFAPLGLERASYGWSRKHAEWTVWGHTNRGALGNQFGRDLGTKLMAVADRWGKPMDEWTGAETLRAVTEADSRLPQLPNFLIPNVAGSLLCTGPEYARYLAALIGGRGPVSGADRDLMLSPRVALKPTLSWGLGWGLERRPGSGLFWHWGDNGVFRAFTVGDATAGRAIVVFTNAESGPKVYQRVVKAATGLELDAFLWV